MSEFFCEADMCGEGCCQTQCEECMAYAHELSDDSDLPCGCDHIDTSCDAPGCPLKRCDATGQSQ